MFTGIIQELGTISLKKEGVYNVETNLDLSDCKEGSSVSCNGVCLTAKNIIKNKNNHYNFDVNIGEETLLRTNLSQNMSKDKKINIEKSLKIGDEIGGHFVYGHIDCTTSVKDIIQLNNSWEFYFEKNFHKNNKFISEKASISINGISLTIANVLENTFVISVIDHTYTHTNLQYSKINDQVNIEFDYLARFGFNNE